MKIAITGTEYYWGKRMLKELVVRDHVDSLLTLDVRPPQTALEQVTSVKLTFKQPFHTLWVKGLADFAPDALLLCPFGPDICYQNDQLRHLNGIQNSLRIVKRALELEIPKIILLSSALVYGARSDNPVFLDEDSLLMGDRQYQHMRDIIELDEACSAASSSKSNRSAIIILRPVLVMGPTVENCLTRYCRLPLVPSFLGFDPVLQFIHEDDVVVAILKAIDRQVKGAFNLAGEGFITWHEFMAMIGKTTVPVFHMVANFVAEQLWRFNISEFSPAFFSLLRYRMIVETKKSKEILQFQPRYRPKKAIDDFKRTLST
ncbi:NAD-dependent epimerase/dehydratase family protein [candidate division CSSED10-310 bacterium]|uniref:NAD-dependent epimerase/dehydratase family protein n=1 Tax=candidate division CSSED10-310 bacterium TaxID=2855610 RepID=A0ABV6Z5G2_UNCC1